MYSSDSYESESWSTLNLVFLGERSVRRLNVGEGGGGGAACRTEMAVRWAAARVAFFVTIQVMAVSRVMPSASRARLALASRSLTVPRMFWRAVRAVVMFLPWERVCMRSRRMETS